MTKFASAGIAVMTLAAAICAQTAIAGAANAQTGDAAHGKTLFDQRCSVCHSTSADDPSEGPSLGGVVGRKAGSEPHFTGYSKALQASGLTWTPANLSTFITAPGTMVPGTMMVITLGQQQDRDDIIAYLATTTP